MRALSHTPGFLLIVSMWLMLCPMASAQTATASYQALNWDKEITLPPDAYRAAKGIDLNGDFTVKTQPETLVEGVGFHARSGVQHWHVEGTLFRRVNVTVKRNGSGHGIDSVFEDFDFNKDDNWYNFWWSTRWRFDNCVFTKKLLRSDLPPLDYSVHATRCTFYEIKLPTVGFKENPANYLGKEDMVFEKCRFVDCDVPQSFLAATVDCVFEKCRFEPKSKLQWPKETTAIKVHAYYEGLGNEVGSFVNGPLTVEFEEAPHGGEFGSTVPHTQSGGRVTMTNLHLSGQFVQFGTTPRKASEIVDVPVVAAEAGTSSPAASTGSAPAVAPAGPSAPRVAAVSEVHSVEELFRALPGNLELRVGGKPNGAAIEAANAFLAKNYAGHLVSMRLTSTGVQATSVPGSTYQANGHWQDVLYHGAAVPACAVALFPAANAAALAKLPPKTEFPMSGIVSKAEFTARGDTLSFVLYVAQARVMDALAVLKPAGAAPSEAATAGDAQMVGTWRVLIRDQGWHVDQTYAADHSYTIDGRHAGTWETKGSQFLVHVDGAGIDAYELPVRDGVLYGKNLDNWPLTAVREGTPTPPGYQKELVGTWEFFNHDGEGWRKTYRFTADHTFMEGEQLIGHWTTLGHSLSLAWEGHDDWHDTFELPGTNEVLNGVNGFHHSLTLTRLDGASAQTDRGKSDGSGKEDGSYFGSKGGGGQKP